MTSLSALSVDELADGICLRAGRIAAAQAELLLWIAEFDRREGWAGTGMLSCAHWLSWRTGTVMGTARDQVRVARRLQDLPPLAAAFADGRVSYSKARAITRVAEPDDGIDWVDWPVTAPPRSSTRSSAGWPGPGGRRGARRPRQARGGCGRACQLRRRRQLRADDPRPRARCSRSSWPAWTPRRHSCRAERAAHPWRPSRRRRHSRHRHGHRHRGAAARSPDPHPAPAGAGAAGGAGAALRRAAGAARSRSPRPPQPPAEDRPAGTPVQRLLDASTGSPPPSAHSAPSRSTTTAPHPRRHRHRRRTPMPGRRPPHGPRRGRGRPDGPAPPNDADALVALAEDALATERTSRPDSPAADRRRTVQIDPLSGWARQLDGELLPPSSLTAV